jgi:hypothetical protein
MGLVNIVMEPQVSYKAGNFLTTWVTVSQETVYFIKLISLSCTVFFQNYDIEDSMPETGLQPETCVLAVKFDRRL